MRADHGVCDSDLVLDVAVLCDGRETLNADVVANGASPGDDRIADESVVSDGCVRNDAAVGQSDTCSDLAVGSNSHIGSQFAVSPDT